MPSIVLAQALTPSNAVFNGTRLKHEEGNDRESDMGKVLWRDIGEGPNQTGWQGGGEKHKLHKELKLKMNPGVLNEIFEPGTTMKGRRFICGSSLKC